MKKVFMSFMICFLMISFCSSVFAEEEVLQIKTKFIVMNPTIQNDKSTFYMKHIGVNIDYKRNQIMGIYYLPELHQQYPTVIPEMVMLIGPYKKGHKTRLTWVNSPTILEGYTEFVNP